MLLTTRRTAMAARTAAVNQLKALIVGAPEELRADLRSLPTRRQIAVCAALRDRPTRSLEHQMTMRVLRSTARRIQALQAEAEELHGQLQGLTAAIAPWLLELFGVGPVSAAQLLVSWSHAGPVPLRGRLRRPGRDQPDPASSGKVTRHRLNRGGDRQLNQALHTIALVRLRDDLETRAYATRRTTEGKSP